MKFFMVLMLLVTFLCSCESSKIQTNSSNENTNSKKSENINSNNENTNSKKETSLINNDLKKEIDNYIDKHFAGWKIKGFENYADCETPCRIHLTKNKIDKVIILVGKEFDDKDGNKYWLVYEADKMDLAEQKLANQKEEWKSDVEEEWKSTFLENLSDLSDDDKETIMDFAREEIREEDESYAAMADDYKSERQYDGF